MEKVFHTGLPFIIAVSACFQNVTGIDQAVFNTDIGMTESLNKTVI
jgi:hypothetical protein